MRTKGAQVLLTLLVAALGALSLAQVRRPEPMVKLLPGDSEMDDRFGWSVAISGNTIVVGAQTKDASEEMRDSGAAYIFEDDGKESSGWRRLKKIEASDRAADSRFGHAVAVSGEFLVVGAQAHNAKAGAAYIFRRSTGGGGHWEEIQKLQAADGAAGQRFGWSVAISDDTVVVGTPADDDKGADSGSAYIFERHAGESRHWAMVSKLTAADGAEGDNFGAAIAISADWVVVGAPRHDQGAGAAYVFERNQGEAPSGWREMAKLQSADAGAKRQFGAAISIDGNRVLIGAPNDANNGDSSGAAYLFELISGEPAKWQQVQKFKATDGEAGEYFGLSLALAGERMLIGSVDNDAGNHAGAVYLFERTVAGEGVWEQPRKITSPETQAGLGFFRVGLQGNTAVVGAAGGGGGEPGYRFGSAYVFAAGLPRFADHPANDKFTGQPAAPVLSSAEARRYRTVIRQQAAAGPNFASQYTIARWGCGSTCVGFAVVDARNGKVHFHPEVRRAMQVAYQVDNVLQFRPDSRLLVIAGEIEGPSGQSSKGKFYYEWVNNGFRRIAESDIQLEPGAPPLPPGMKLDNLCNGIDNSLECAQEIERYQLQKPDHARRVKRAGGELQLKLTSGRWLAIEDEKDRGEEGGPVKHSFREYLSIGYFLIHRQFYEGADYLMIQERSGERFELHNLPVISPDQQRLVTASDGVTGGYSPNAIQVWHLSEKGLELEQTLEPEGWGPSDPQWVDNQTIRVTKRSPQAAEGAPAKEAVIAYRDGKWKVE
jgi:hypothetical protein